MSLKFCSVEDSDVPVLDIFNSEIVSSPIEIDEKDYLNEAFFSITTHEKYMELGQPLRDAIESRWNGNKESWRTMEWSNNVLEYLSILKQKDYKSPHCTS